MNIFCALMAPALILLGSPAMSQPETAGFAIAGLPGSLHWVNAPVRSKTDAGTLRISAAGKTDLFVDPQEAYTVVNSPKALFQPDEEFLLSARVATPFRSDYDAGVLVLWAGPSDWAKLCFEFSPQKKPFVVSVVNNGISDDCNHVPISNGWIYLRIAGLGHHCYAFHYSMDGKAWNLVRYFTLSSTKAVAAGFSSQSPTGSGCESAFSAITYQKKKLADIRNGQ